MSPAKFANLVFFILCDNIAKHSRLLTVPVELNVTEDTGKFCIEVINQLGEEVDLHELRGKSALISKRGMGQDEWDLLRREGGSGLTKIHKIIRYEIGADAYNLGLDILEGRRFSVRLTLPEKGIFDESPRSR